MVSYVVANTHLHYYHIYTFNEVHNLRTLICVFVGDILPTVTNRFFG